MAHDLALSQPFLKLVDYLLHEISEELKRVLVSTFEALLKPFQYVQEAIETITVNTELMSRFKELMQKFLSQYDQRFVMLT